LLDDKFNITGIWLAPPVLDSNMKTSRNLGLVAIALFVVSHLLPAYSGGASGFDCFVQCWKTLLRPGDGIGGWLYYSGFVVSNILFVGLAAALFVTKKSRRLRSALSVVIFLQVLSWLVLHVFPEPSHVGEIEIGYYVWLTGFGLLVAAHFSKRPAESVDSIPLAPSAA
jgi:hypothetical protein